MAISCYKLVNSIIVWTLMHRTAAASNTIVLSPTENNFKKCDVFIVKPLGICTRTQTALHICYLLTDTAFARHVTQLSKCLTEQMGLIRIPKGMSTLTMPRGVNAPIWHLHAFPHQHIHYCFAWLQMDPFLSQRTKCKWIELFPVCSIFVFCLKRIPNNSKLHPLIVSCIH